MDSLTKSNNKTSYIIDWVVLAIVAALMGITGKVKPFERQFELDDATISHPHKGDTVKMSYLIAFAFISSFIVITGFQFAKKSLKYDYHQAIMGLLLSVCISTLFCHIIKAFVGRYRPDFMSVCDVDFNKVKELYDTYKDVPTDISFGPRNLFNTTICKASKKDLYEERRSFPSGHSTFAFSVMTYLSLYIAGQIHLIDKKVHVWKYVVVSIPYCLAIMVALSRVFDYRHHWQDVTVGSILGVFFSILTYFYYYPSLLSVHCDSPHQRYYYIEENENENKNEYSETITMV